MITPKYKYIHRILQTGGFEVQSHLSMCTLPVLLSCYNYKTVPMNMNHLRSNFYEAVNYSLCQSSTVTTSKYKYIHRRLQCREFQVQSHLLKLTLPVFLSCYSYKTVSPVNMNLLRSSFYKAVNFSLCQSSTVTSNMTLHW